MGEMENISHIMPLLYDPQTQVSAQAIRSLKTLANDNPEKIFRLIESEIRKQIEDLHKCIVLVRVLVEISTKSEISHEIKILALEICMLVTDKHRDTASELSKTIPNILYHITTNDEEILNKFLEKFLHNQEFIPIDTLAYFEMLKHNGLAMKDRLDSDLQLLCPIMVKEEAISFRLVFASIIDKVLDIITKNEMTVSFDLAILIIDKLLTAYLENNIPIPEKKRYLDMIWRLLKIASHEIPTSKIQLAFTKIGVLLLNTELYEKTANLLSLFINYAEDTKFLGQYIPTIIPPLIRNMKPPAQQAYDLIKHFAQINPHQTVVNILSLMKEGKHNNIFKSINYLLDRNLITSESGLSILVAMESALSIQIPSNMRKLLFAIWEKLAKLGVETASIIPSLFIQASSPQSADTIKDFEKSALVVAEKLNYPQLPNYAFDTKYIAVANIAFEMINKMNCGLTQNIMTQQQLMLKTLLYASSAYFPVQTRRIILKTYARLTNSQEFDAAAESLQSKYCLFNATKTMINFIRKMANQTFDSESWIKICQDIVDGFSKEKHEMANTAKLLPDNTMAHLKASMFLILTGVYTSDINKSNALTKIQSLMNKVECKYIEETLPLTLSLIELRRYFEKIADDLYRSKSDSVKGDNGVSRKTMTLIYNYKHGNLDDSTAEMCLSFDIPSIVACHAQRKVIIKKGKVNNVEKHISLLDRFLGNKDNAICKIAIDTFYFMLKQNLVSSTHAQFSNMLKRIVLQLRYNHDQKTVDKIMEIISVSPPEVNFANILSSLLAGEKMYDQKLMQICKDIVEKCTNIYLIKTPTVAASISVLGMEEEFKSDVEFFQKRIFSSKSEYDAFPVSYFTSSQPKDVDEFVPFLFSFMNLQKPWNLNASTIIQNLMKCDRFLSILDGAIVDYSNSMTALHSPGFIDIGVALFNIDKVKFIMSLLNKPSVASKEILQFFSMKYDVFGQCLIDCVTFNAFSDKSSLHDSFLKIVTKCEGITENLTHLTYIAIVQVLAQSELLLNDTIEALNTMKKYYKDIDSSAVQIALTDAQKNKKVTFQTVSSLLSVVSELLNVSNLIYFAKFCPSACLAGYTAISNHDKPLLVDILNLSDKSPNAALLALQATITYLPPERYGNSMINNAFDFILSQCLNDEDSYKCLMKIYRWLPKDILYEKSVKMFSTIKNGLNVTNPYPYLFNFLTQVADSKHFIGRQEFRNYIPYFIIACYGFTEHYFPEVMAAARSALAALCRHTAMLGTEKMLMNSIGQLTDFAVDGLKVFVREMDMACVNACCLLVEHTNDLVKFKAAEVLIASIHFGKCLDQNAHLKLVTLLSSESEKVKTRVLKALAMYPPKV
ncbi:hypothetical protein TVAG_104410 [Trichomonas vaginalis G3]|uniref:Uncharacterized protein n=1 Tax=Trichomonas vaginalis (strain ATCC PRA-98 / G3) TaxID=412133 RepID=A2F689_TRIV3|nr:armadillo (ARM) repeat-containing protein family [Trichomonas vaginalis G3]EAX99560.1 hypothetical protein TVAG_104410 [Trichomonas vaginalis G3]KAI5490945.1 armadillo (ARM) repeat-containing protein family [Trichomonas vaginalis G3]|eukprot:XP_001312490.1 hypothetical protein [Trichomonas vaginalis G3]